MLHHCKLDEGDEEHIPEEQASASFDPAKSMNPKKAAAAASIVDLTLASTYIPAITCLLRTTMLVVLMSR